MEQNDCLWGPWNGFHLEDKEEVNTCQHTWMNEVQTMMQAKGIVDQEEEEEEEEEEKEKYSFNKSLGSTL